MSLNFAIKDLLHFKEQTKAHLKTNSSIIALVVLFLNLTSSMNLLSVQSPLSYLTLTLFELITQYHRFLVILIVILVFVVMLNSNHAIIEHRKKDIGIMKAVGTYPNQLYSFYLTELLLLAFWFHREQVHSLFHTLENESFFTSPCIIEVARSSRIRSFRPHNCSGFLIEDTATSASKRSL